MPDSINSDTAMRAKIMEIEPSWALIPKDLVVPAVKLLRWKSYHVVMALPGWVEVKRGD